MYSVSIAMTRSNSVISFPAADLPRARHARLNIEPRIVMLLIQSNLGRPAAAAGPPMTSRRVRTFRSCGSSSRLVRRNQRPEASRPAGPCASLKSRASLYTLLVQELVSLIFGSHPASSGT